MNEPDLFKTRYSKTNCEIGIVHLGYGAFHRAHQAWYIHRLFEKGLNFDWGIVGAGVCTFDKLQREKLKKQDFLTTLIELDPDGNKNCEIVGPMIDYVPVEKKNLSLINAMSDSRIRIVSLTVTEGGYFLDGESGELDFINPDIVNDIKLSLIQI